MRHATILGAGRIGLALARLGPATVVRRGEAVPDGTGPVYVCTRNDDLEAAIAAVPAARHTDLVFVQNGMVGPWLAERGLAGCTRALLYIAVARRGDAPVDGESTVASGPWAGDLCQRFAAGGLTCEVVDSAAFRVAEVEKLLWIAVFGVLCDVHDAPAGVVAERHRDDVDALATELAGACERALGVALPSGLPGRLVAYSRTIPAFRASVKELRWRNGWIHAQEATPRHTAWLAALGHLAPA